MEADSVLKFNNKFLCEKIIIIITLKQTTYPIFLCGESKRNIVCFCLDCVVKRSENLNWCNP